MRLSDLVREPVLQFLLLGALLFGVERAVGPDEGATPVSTDTVTRLSDGYTAREGRPPTDAERAALIEDHADQQRLVREAQRLGLDDADPIVRRRLVQKLDLVAERTPPIPTPDDATLQAWLDAHPDDFARPETTDGIAIRVDDVAAARGALEAGAAPGSLGAPGPYPPRWTGLTTAQRAGRYGDSVAAVDAVGVWTDAGGGWLVRVEAVRPSRPARLDEVRDAVQAAWEADQRDQRRAALRDRLRTEWPTVVE